MALQIQHDGERNKREMVERGGVVDDGWGLACPARHPPLL